MAAATHRRWRLVHLALLLVPVAAVAFVLSRGREVHDQPAQVLAALRAQAGPRLPPAAAAQAASATAPERYDRDRLAELIDGAAERYLERGFESCLAAVYSYPEAGGLEISAESHRFRDAGGARAQAEAERPSAGQSVEGAPGAVTDGQVLLALHGRSLLKLTALSVHPGARDRLLALAAAWRKDQP